jgi:hypothetical protein
VNDSLFIVKSHDFSLVCPVAEKIIYMSSSIRGPTSPYLCGLKLQSKILET